MNQIIFTLTTLLLALPAFAVVAADKREIVMSLEPQKIVTLNRKIFGVNHGNEGRPHRDSYQTIRPEDIALRLPLVRINGGTHANFWDWQQGRFVAPDLIMPFRNPAESDIVAMSARWQNAHQEYHGGIITVDAQAQWAKGVGAEVIRTLNLFTGTPEKSASWLRYNLEHGYDSTYWELGNEAPLSIYRSKYTNDATYFAEAALHAKAMRAVKPDVRLGLTEPEIYKDRANKLKGDMINILDRATAGKVPVPAEKFYDAIIIHPYFGIMNEAVTNMTENAVHAALMSLAESRINNKMRELIPIFGKDCKVWITEWNYHPGQFKNLCFQNITRTMSHALVIADFLYQMMRWPENIEIAALHDLNGHRGFPCWSLYSFTDTAATNTVVFAPYYAFQMFSAGSAGCDGYFFPRLSGVDMINNPLPRLKWETGERVESYPAVEAVCFTKARKVREIILINKSTTTQHLSFGKHINAVLHTLQAPSPIERWPRNLRFVTKMNGTTTYWDPAFTISTVNFSDTQYALPPFAITRFSLLAAQ